LAFLLSLFTGLLGSSKFFLSSLAFLLSKLTLLRFSLGLLLCRLRPLLRLGSSLLLS